MSTDKTLYSVLNELKSNQLESLCFSQVKQMDAFKNFSPTISINFSWCDTVTLLRNGQVVIYSRSKITLYEPTSGKAIKEWQLESGNHFSVVELPDGCLVIAHHEKLERWNPHT